MDLLALPYARSSDKRCSISVTMVTSSEAGFLKFHISFTLPSTTFPISSHVPSRTAQECTHFETDSAPAPCPFHEFHATRRYVLHCTAKFHILQGHHICLQYLPGYVTRSDIQPQKISQAGCCGSSRILCVVSRSAEEALGMSTRVLVDP